MRYTRAIIDRNAIKNNLTTISKSIVNPQQTNVMAVVKANAYGHGLVEIARTASEWGASHLAVAIPDEGAELRKAKIDKPILVFGLIAPEEALLCVENELIVTVCDKEHIEPLSAAAKKLGRKAKLMLKVDTGMNRIGTDHDGAIMLARQINALPELELYGMFTHFASAGGPDFTYAKMQEQKFAKLVKKMEDLQLRPKFISASASSASLTMPESQYDLVRAGISMYGLYPSNYVSEQQKLEPALSFVTNISYIKKVPANTAIGYEMTYKTKEDCFIATLPLGYGDGYSRRLSNKAQVLINGELYPICSNICMDQMMICLGPKNNAKVGDRVTLVGAQGNNRITFEQLAQTVGTINYELACNISQRVPRTFIN